MNYRSENERLLLRVLLSLLKLGPEIMLDPEGLMQRAAKNQKSTDWGEGDFRTGLQKFCSSVNEDSGLHSLARLLVRRITRLRLEDRLRIERYLRQNPEILEQPVEAPIMITGLPRSGTTFLQRLLAVDSRFRVTRTWELYDPVPSPDPNSVKDRRIRRMKWDIRILRWLAPKLDEAHPLEAEGPEECYILLERVFNQPTSCIFLDLPKYQDWLLNRPLSDLVSDYEYYKKQLQILQWKDSSRRWLLKAPTHSLYLDAVVKVFPDIQVIIAERDPLEVIPSLCSLSARMRSALYRRDNLTRLGERLTGLMATGRKRMEKARSSINRRSLLTYEYSELMSDPISIVRQVYKFSGSEFSSTTEEKMRTFLEESKKGIHTRHCYSMEDFELTPEKIQVALSNQHS